MLEALLLSSLLFCGLAAPQGSDMDDADFEAYVKMHDDFRQENGDAFAKGCVNGAAAGAVSGGGFQALCIGCVAAGAGNVAQDKFFPEDKKK